MIGFLLRGLKGVILGWLMSLVFFLVKRALAKALGGMPPQMQTRNNPPASASAPAPSAAPPPASTPTAEVIETIWAGMSATELESTFGAPATRTKTDTGDVWVYSDMDGGHTNTAIIIEGGVVKSWSNNA